MTAETVTAAVAKRDNGVAALITKYSGDFAGVLPSHIKPATWIRLAQGALRRDEKLAAVAAHNPGSFMAALLECARLGHEPATENFYLVPFGNEIQGIEGYRGVIERMYRAGAVATVKAELVYAKDLFEYRPQTMRVPKHEPDWFGDRGDLIGAYSYAEMKDGTTSRVVVIGMDYIEKVMKESRGSGRSDSPWQKWREQMVLKTAANRLEPWVPTSSEYIREQLRAVQDVAAERTAASSTPAKPVASSTPEPIDAEVIEDSPEYQEHVSAHNDAPAPSCSFCDAELAEPESEA